MAIISKPYTFSKGFIDPAQVNANFDALFSLVNGLLEGINIRTNTIEDDNLATDISPVTRWKYSFQDFVVSGLTVAASGGTAICTVAGGVAFVSGEYLTVSSSGHTFSGDGQYYCDLCFDGTFSWNSNSTPATNYTRLAGILVTSGVAVCTDLRNLTPIGTTNIEAGAVFDIDAALVTALASQVPTNIGAAGSGVTITMPSTTLFAVNDLVTVSSSAGSEDAKVTTVTPATSIVVDTIALTHTATNPLVTCVHAESTASATRATMLSSSVTNVKNGDSLFIVMSGSFYTTTNAALANFGFTVGGTATSFEMPYNIEVAAKKKTVTAIELYNVTSDAATLAVTATWRTSATLLNACAGTGLYIIRFRPTGA